MIPEDFSTDVWGYCANQKEDIPSSIWEKNSIFMHRDMKPLSREELTKIYIDLNERIGELEKDLKDMVGGQIHIHCDPSFSDIWENDEDDWWSELDAY